MERQALDLLTVPPLPIPARRGKCNPVTRIGALSEGRAEKAALGNGYRSRVNSGQTTSRKERHSLSRNGYRGRPHPLPLTPNWLAKGYLHQCHNATTARGNPKGGDRDWPTLRAVQVNTIESAGRASRFATLCSDLRGWTWCALRELGA